MAASAVRIDIVIPNESTALVDLAKAMQHSFQQHQADLEIAILTPTQIGSDHHGDLAVAVSDSLLPWVHSAGNPYSATLCFYVSSVKYQAYLPTARKVSALYRDQPLERQLRLAKLLLPNLQRVALIYGSDGPPADLAALGRQEGVTINGVDIHNQIDWAKSLSQLMADNDILLGVDDPETYNSDTIRSILLTTYRRGKFLIGPNRPFVSAGSLASAYTSSDQFLHQLTTMVAEYLRRGSLPRSQYPHAYRIAINAQVAASLGLSLPGEDDVYQRMTKTAGGRQ